MRKPKYISPTSLAKFYDDRDEFYLQYLADNRPPRYPQTQPMSIGSAFDAYVKSYLHYTLFGNCGKDDEFELQNIMKLQVEAHNYAWAVENGRYVFDCYKRSGALADLMIELKAASEDPKFEFTIENRVGRSADFQGVPILGKPDIFFVAKGGAHVILDWKVNGYCSKSPTSPKAGYIKIRDSWGSDVAKPSRGAGGMHKDVQLMKLSGMDINIATFFESVDVTWANQLSMYGWVLGEPIGGKTVIGIDQIVAKPNGDKMPLLRIATHRSRVSENYQKSLFDMIRVMWTCIENGYIFTEMTRVDSDERCLMLDEQYKAFEPTDDPKEQWFQNATRQQRNF